MHQRNNYPALKPPSSLDVELPDAMGDEAYLELLAAKLPPVLEQFQPQLLFYVAGADPYREDQLGGLALTISGLRRRDEYVFTAARDHAMPVAVVLAGGYARNVADTVAIHCNTVVAARDAANR